MNRLIVQPHSAMMVAIEIEEASETRKLSREGCEQVFTETLSTALRRG